MNVLLENTIINTATQKKNHSIHKCTLRFHQVYKQLEAILKLPAIQNSGGAMIMTKKAIIEVSLVEESNEKPTSEIKKEILSELSENLHAIPWAEKIEKLTIAES